jgi:hypothetical protein
VTPRDRVAIMKERVLFFPASLDLSQPVYRIFRRPRFEDTITSRRLTFVRPGAWDDPWDRPPIAQLVYRDSRPYRLEIARDCEDAIYVQCWSAVKESDTLWRAYSMVKKDSSGRNLYPNDEGIKVETTVQKIIDAFEASDAPRDWRLLIGAVDYHTEDEINEHIANQVGTFGSTSFVSATETAAVLLKKRSAFAHESEIRLFVVDPSNEPNRSTVSISFDPNSLFNEIAF